MSVSHGKKPCTLKPSLSSLYSGSATSNRESNDFTILQKRWMESFRLYVSAKRNSIAYQSTQAEFRNYSLLAQEEQMTALSYSDESCAWCAGTGAVDGELCDCCGGLGQVSVLQPSIVCPRCHGTGKATSDDQFLASDKCLVCLGSGWARGLTFNAGRG